MFKRILGGLVWLITSLGAIHVGLVALGYDIFMRPIFLTTLIDWVKPIHYVIGVAGLLSLIMFFSSLSACKHCTCGCTEKCSGK